MPTSSNRRPYRSNDAWTYLKSMPRSAEIPFRLPSGPRNPSVCDASNMREGTGFSAFHESAVNVRWISQTLPIWNRSSLVDNTVGLAWAWSADGLPVSRKLRPITAASNTCLDANVFIPQLRMLGDELFHQPDAPLVLHDLDAHTSRAEQRLLAG